MLVETSRTTEVRGEVITDGYRYEVTYSLNGKELTRIHCNVNKKVSEEVETPEGKQTVESQQYVGIMFKESGNKQISLQEGEEIAPHVVVFEQVLSEVSTLLNPVPAKTTK
ncbi:hypothetical protein [Bacteroides neonati]|uniref:hypothetical protein n=1 Tax=Bacteroides neonati TaxID=1347393 RepID=UPI0004BBE7FF|nr:hypothetical protein [Bacteroides neonati]